jgi:hypothetical protein
VWCAAPVMLLIGFVVFVLCTLLNQHNNFPFPRLISSHLPTCLDVVLPLLFLFDSRNTAAYRAPFSFGANVFQTFVQVALWLLLLSYTSASTSWALWFLLCSCCLCTLLTISTTFFVWLSNRT